MYLLRKKMRFISVFLFLCFLFTMIKSYNSPVYSDSLDSLQDEYSQLEKKQEELESKLKQTKNNIDKEVDYQKQLDEQIDAIERQIEILQVKIYSLELQIEEKNKEIEQRQIQIDKNFELYKERLRANYMSNNDSALGVLLTAKSLGDFLRQATISKKIADHDADLINQLKVQKKEIEEAKQVLADNMKELENSNISFRNKTALLNESLSKSVNMVNRLKDLETQYNQDKERLDREMAEVELSIQKLLEQTGNSSFVGGSFTWPVPGYTYLSSTYGWRFDGKEFHKGIDITGSNIHGKNVVAANAGKVVLAFDNDRPGVSYGKYIIIDHGGGYSTLYGHNSKLLVKEGDWVRRGQVISQVGSTGWSTGPHLHFEVRINGKHVNPLDYVKRP